MKLTFRDGFVGNDGVYVEVKIGRYEACCVKFGKTTYVIQCYGNEVYSDIGGCDFPLRKLTDKECKEVIKFAEGYKEAVKVMKLRGDAPSIKEKDPILCGVVWCHGKRDFSVWEGDISPEDRAAIEAILEKYVDKGTSERNCWEREFNEVFYEEY